ncbi:MAG: hypothetical protein FK730_12635 [Asgard group archaeon]|nr:hypothetical protein [Asgard group archaeon]
MFVTQKYRSIPLAFLILFLTCSFIFYLPLSNANEMVTTNRTKPNNGSILEFSTNEGAYFADINWVNTTINLDNKGAGTVGLIINCTPTEDHFGIYIRAIASGEVSEIIPEESYAINAEQTLSLNYTFVNDNNLAFRIFIEEPELLDTNKTIQYYFSYKANFFTSKEIKHFEVDTELVIIDFLRPTWDGDLEYQNLEITLPIEVNQSTVTQTDLDEFKFSVEDYMNDFYNLTYKTKYSGGKYWFVFNCRKDSMQPLGSFEAQFYVSYEYFSLPTAINWLVGLIASIFTVGSIAVLLIVITVRKKTKTEIEEFESGLYELIEPDES